MDCTRDIGMIIMFIIIIFLVIKIQKMSKKLDKENFALSSEDLSAVRNEINRIYDMDVEAIRNLGAISKSLLTGTNTFTASANGTPGELKIPADRTILQGGFRLENSTWEKTVAGHPNNVTVGHIVSDNTNYKKLMIVGNNTAGGARKVGIWDDLEVNGNLNVGGTANTVVAGIALNNSTWGKTHNSSGAGNSVGYIVSDNDAYKKLMIVGNNTGGGVRKVGIWDDLEVNGNLNVRGGRAIVEYDGGQVTDWGAMNIQQRDFINNTSCGVCTMYWTSSAGQMWWQTMTKIGGRYYIPYTWDGGWPAF